MRETGGLQARTIIDRKRAQQQFQERSQGRGGLVVRRRRLLRGRRRLRATHRPAA